MDIEEAGEYIEVMRQQGWYIKLELFPELDMPNGDHRYRCTMAGPEDDDGTIRCDAPSLAQAILNVAEQMVSSWDTH